MQRALIGGSEPVPTLAELFDAFPDARFNIDLKSAGAVPALARFLDERAGLGPGLRRARSPAVGCAASAASPRAGGRPRRRPARWRRTGCSPPASPRLRHPRAGRSVLQVPHRRGRLTIVTAGLVRRAHAAGVQVHVWTIDDPDEMKALLDLGVDGLMTDRTDILRAVLTESGRWRTRR